jgi:hypothetical protein
MAKEVSFAKPRQRPDPAALDAFVHGEKFPAVLAEVSATTSQPEAAALLVAPKVPMKRLTFDIPAATHLRMKLDCVSRSKDMAEELREMIEKRWPAV